MSFDTKAAARAIARESRDPVSPDQITSQWRLENIVGLQRAQIRMPVRNVDEVRQSLRTIHEEVTQLLVDIEGAKADDCSALLMVRSVFKGIDKRLNAYRRGR